MALIFVEKMLKNIYISFVFLSVLFWLMLNYGAGISCDEVWQVLQWRQFCLRSYFVCLVLMVLVFLNIEKQSLVNVIEFSIIVLCTVEAIYSLLQLYGFLMPKHSLFKVTGSFYNPGPLGGFLAVGVPLVVNKILGCNSSQKYSLQKIALYTALTIIIIALPSTMSRTAWIAASVAVVYVFYANGKIEPLIKKMGIKPCYIVLIFTIIVFVGAVFLWQIKKDSATGRLLLWKISARAVSAAPFVGSGDFVPAYSAAQEYYFKNCNATLSEKLAAGCPDYAFNEYLQIAVEYGVVALLLVLAFLVLTLIKSHRQKTFGLTSALLSIMVFAFASYPLHLPAFVAIGCMVVFGVYVCNANNIRQKLVAAIIPFLVLVFSVIKLPEYSQKSESILKWQRLEFFYNNKNYDGVVSKYAPLYSFMKWNPRFAYEYGHSLCKIEKYEEAIPVLENCLNHSSDPMPLNLLGECHRSLKHFETAEQCYRRAAYRIPSRLYPHCLLYFLYAEDGYANPSLRREEYNQVMHMPIKTESPATRDLRQQVEEKEKTMGEINNGSN